MYGEIVRIVRNVEAESGHVVRKRLVAHGATGFQFDRDVRQDLYLGG
jgi:hypothetical protein